ncbi:P-loop containing nucleoside triphosphate hydrolase protein [Macrolepiota fuliginosa MF-IS2]|uniref:P-loop containing nucleoside triphosphate hydrolase protein n=1 Tax=Macrolepiota fuliginosa MF-IS2 TaxID=1400762 RepID=A0A9P5X7F8_9AGAR|nr:P-loop containing nucleoside triphosphate hydrolase protein [Macrolepiota fuliginosa MF-IS2]
MSASSGDSGKRALFRTLLGHLRVLSEYKAQDGLYPFLGKNVDPYAHVASVSFSHRPGRGAGGAFYDYTARYGAIRDEDALTLRESMFPESIPDDKPNPLAGSPFDKPKIQKPAFDDVVKLSDEDKLLFNYLVKDMDLERLLDLPLIALSNGQTRRARIVRAVLKKPQVMLLDEPLTGLDVSSRPKLLHLLHKLHQTRKPRVILGLRTQDDVPEWITHVALVQDGTVNAGPKDRILPLIKHDSPFFGSSNAGDIKNTGPIVLDLQSVSVKYADRIVLRDINWQVRQGERWHLQGANGSGKTTLLSLILGDHPQSYIQPHLLLPSPPHPSIPSKFVLNHRKRIPTAHLRQSIGAVSPELFDAFPRRHPGMSVLEAIGTGFEGVFVPLPGGGLGATEPGKESLHEWRKERVWEMLENLGPSAWAPSEYPREVAQEFAEKRFTDLSMGGQRMVLLMRALVGRPPVVLLDEVWSGMNEEMVGAARKYLREGIGSDQAVVVITHWEDEVPWTESEGVIRFRLEDGKGIVT